MAGLRDAAAVVDPLQAGGLTLLASHLREKRLEPVVVLLAPLLERMVMTTRTLDAQAQEQLGRILDLGRRLGDLAVPRRRRMLTRLPCGRQQFANQLIVGPVVVQVGSQPVVERKRDGLVRFGPAFVAEDGVPLVGKVLGVVGPVEQPVNPPAALVRVGIGQKLLRLLQPRQPAGDVDRQPAQESRVVGRRGRGQSERLQVGEHQLINERFGWRKVLYRNTQRNGAAEHAHLPVVAGHDRHAAGQLLGRDQAADVDGRHFHVIRVERRAASDIRRAAVRVMGQDDQLLLAIAAQNAFRREHLDARDRRIVRIAIRHALFDPAAERAIGGGCGIQPLPAPVRQLAGRLQQQQAAVRSGGEQPASASLLDQVFEILRRLEAQQRQGEPVLAARLPVAAAAVAAVFGEDGDDLVRES